METKRVESLNGRLFGTSELLRDAASSPQSTNETVLYLAYGSNLSMETFRGRRSIRPLSQINVVVPQLSLTFDLPGLPYSEPCFGNTRYRQTDEGPQGFLDEKQPLMTPADYHKDRWQKGLVGVVYEVTKADFAHIIATEGGGASYRDVLVDCFALSRNPSEEVPLHPTGQPFKAHTLFSPPRIVRPDPSWAQPSSRYLKLIMDGAAELSLPYEYQDFLKGIRSFHITTQRQRLGSFVFLLIWAPWLVLALGGSKIFLDKQGHYPAWFVALTRAFMSAVWASYDDIFKPLFGDGERTIEDNDECNKESLRRTSRGKDMARYVTKPLSFETTLGGASCV